MHRDAGAHPRGSRRLFGPSGRVSDADYLRQVIEVGIPACSARLCRRTSGSAPGQGSRLNVSEKPAIVEWQ
jgi:hypothetical protein